MDKSGLAAGGVKNEVVKYIPLQIEATLMAIVNRMALFADDVAAWVASRSLKFTELRLQKQLQHIETWMSKWRTQISV